MSLIRVYLVVAAFMLVSCSALIFMNNYSHENAHRAVSVYNGCIDYDISYGLLNPHFQCLSYRGGAPVNADLEYLLDGVNEIVSYNLNGIIGVIIVCSVAGMLFFGGAHKYA